MSRPQEIMPLSAGDRAAGGLIGLALADVIGGPRQLACILATSLLARIIHRALRSRLVEVLSDAVMGGAYGAVRTRVAA